MEELLASPDNTSRNNIRIIHQLNQNLPPTNEPNFESKDHLKRLIKDQRRSNVIESAMNGNSILIDDSDYEDSPNPANNTQNQHLQPTSGLINLNVFQFFPVELIVMCDANRLLDLSTDTKMKEALLAQGFKDWTSNDYKAFCEAVQKYGRFDINSVAEMISNKNVDEVAKYHEVFFRRGPKESPEIRTIVKRIKVDEMKNRNRNDALKWKMLQFGRPDFLSSRVTQHAKFTPDHDRYLICAISRHMLAFNVSDRVISDIRYVLAFTLAFLFHLNFKTKYFFFEKRFYLPICCYICKSSQYLKKI